MGARKKGRRGGGGGGLGGGGGGVKQLLKEPFLAPLSHWKTLHIVDCGYGGKDK